MKQNIELISDADCTGCGMCSAICPTKAISVSKDSNGFYKPKIADEQCISCSKCTKVCYKFRQKSELEVVPDFDCYSAVNLNSEELRSSSSGAVSIELMRECLRRDYLVVGVAYDEACEKAVTKIASTEKELEQFRGSKYFQSNTEDAFASIAADQTNQKYAIFGTPCQIYAFNKLAKLQKNIDKYLFVDIFCHGCPSLLVWERYLQYRKEKMNVTAFDNIVFRSKTYGWHEFCFDFFHEGIKKSSSKTNDPFYELFFGMDVMNEACYDCSVRSSVALADIRLGDFWGARFDANTTGVSAVVACSSRGKELFEAVREKFEVAPCLFDEIIEAQSYGKIHTFSSQRREATLASLQRGEHIKKIVKEYRKLMPLKTNIKRNIKRVVKLLPKKMYIHLRYKLHQKQCVTVEERRDG